MSDTAKGPSAGYLYQFELALSELAQLNKSFKLSIEKMDDLAIQDEKGTYVLTIQAKHSICATGTNFGNTSVDLWKTLTLWINKLKAGLLEDGNEFKAITNVSIPSNSIVRTFNKSNEIEVINGIEKIKNELELKISNKAKEGKNSPSNEIILRHVKFVLNHINEFKTILSHFSYIENYNVKEDFFNLIQLATVENEDLKKSIYEGFLGWITNKSQETWNNRAEVEFTKKDFEDKYHHLRDIHPLQRALFRNKKDIPEHQTIDLSSKRDDLYIKQIEDIQRDEDDKQYIIKEAILDFILSDIEISHLITRTNIFTQPDYEDFKNLCLNKWGQIKRKHAPQKPENYSVDELNSIAIKIFDELMEEVKLDFMGNFGFDRNNKYIQNGTFLHLSNEPKIGWNPNWKKKYTS